MVSSKGGEFSFRSRQHSLQNLRNDIFDLLIVGGGITGAAVARDAASRGLKAALVEKQDFAWGTSSRSSKLIHGGLRYLENFEMKLVFEALSERTLLLKTVPHMVRPLPFYLPVYDSDKRGMTVFSVGLWLYDLLALFRTPGFHKRLSRKKLLAEIPFLKGEGLKGGFRYFDASMWDDVLTVEVLRDAARRGAAIASYTEAVRPVWEKERIAGFVVRDREGGTEFPVQARRTIICAGPWLDRIGLQLSPEWKNWLAPSKGVHLVFELKKLPLPGAVVMSHPTDGRIAFAIPRPDFGGGVVIVGTTDGPTNPDPERASIDPGDVDYLMVLLRRYFPSLSLSPQDIISAYIGVRPLMKPPEADNPTLQKVSREHHIDVGPGGVILVAGGKYTTHRTMAEEIVDTALKGSGLENRAGPPCTKEPINPLIEEDARAVAEIHRTSPPLPIEDPEGFPSLGAQLRFNIRHRMVLHLEDFYLRRVPLYLARADHGLPWADTLAQIWAEELGLNSEAAKEEAARLRTALKQRSAWTDRLTR